MSVLQVLEQFMDRTGSGDEKAVREYTRSWLVITSGLLDDAITVTAAPGIPRMFDLYVGSDGMVDSLGATCRKVEAHQESEFAWKVTARYSNRTDMPELGDPNPVNRPTEIEVATERFQKVVDVDQSYVIPITGVGGNLTPDWRILGDGLLPNSITVPGVAVTNSVNEKFDPPVEADDSRLTVRLTRNEVSAPTDEYMAYRDTINSDTFMGFLPYTVKYGALNFRRQFENNFLYWRVTREFQVNFATWYALVLDQGSFCFASAADAAAGKPSTFKDKAGQPLAASLLNGEGLDLRAAKTTLTGNILANSASISVTSSTPFPQSTFPFVVKIDSELIQVNGLQANLFIPVTRGYQNTTAAAHAGGATVQQQPYYRTFRLYAAMPFARLNLP